MKYSEKWLAGAAFERGLRVPLKKSVQAMSGVLLATMGAPGVYAQEQQEAAGILEEVVVTGTLIRGTEVTGSQTIGVDTEAIVEVGAANTNEILASVPQVTNFFNDRAEVDPRAAANLVVSRPNLRNMPVVNSSTSSVTLVLMDGHRLAPVGVQAAVVDADIVLGSVLERVDIVTDGGSSLYGADAVAGVINFVTKDEFDGVKVDLDYGSADDTDTYNVGLTAGTSWGSGSIYFSAMHSERDGLVNGDRDWAIIGQYDDSGEFIPAGESARTECLEPVRTLYGWFNYGAGWTDNPAAPGAGSKSAGDPACDHYAASTMLPEQERSGAFLSYQQEVSDSVNFGVKTYYSERTNTFFSYPMGDVSPAVAPIDTNPVDLTPEQLEEFGLPDPSTIGVGETLDYPGGAGFSYGVHPAYPGRQQEVEMSTWGIAPELTIAMANSWQARTTLYFGHSYNENLQPESNSARMQDYVLSGQLDPLDVASADAAVINDILNWETKKQTIHELFLARVVADGPVMDLPAGELRMAAGFEVNQDRVEARLGTGDIGSVRGIDYQNASRDSTAFFAELHVPVLDSLELSVSLRHDDYSDFGKTTNPQVGFNFDPTHWLRIYGHWGESFNAPTTLDTLAFASGRAASQTVAQVQGNDVYSEWDGMGTDTVVLEGGRPGIQPQTAEAWALGFDLEPLEGLLFKLNYYEIDFDDVIGGLGNITNQDRLDFPDKFTWNYTEEEWAQLLTEIQNPEALDGRIDPTNPNADLAYVFDRRVTNFASAQLKGFDFGASYYHDTDFGTLNFGITGNYQTDAELIQGSTITDSLEGAPDLTFQGTVGWSLDNVRARLTVNYTDSFDVDPGETSMQSKVDEFVVTNLFVGYDFQGSGFTEGLSLRFYVDNVFDEDPPEYRLTNVNEDKFSGFTLGRMYKVGLSYTFF